MKAVVDQDACTGCGICVDTCPEVFEIEGDSAIVIADPIPEDVVSTAEQAVEECPAEAITIE